MEFPKIFGEMSNIGKGDGFDASKKRTPESNIKGSEDANKAWFPRHHSARTKDVQKDLFQIYKRLGFSDKIAKEEVKKTIPQIGNKNFVKESKMKTYLEGLSKGNKEIVSERVVKRFHSDPKKGLKGMAGDLSKASGNTSWIKKMGKRSNFGS